MKKNTGRIVRDHWKRQSLQKQYWAFLAFVKGVKPMFSADLSDFRRIVSSDFLEFVFGSAVPSDDDALSRATEAANWLTIAQDATPDDGVSYGYFPCDIPGGWQTSYPETTGYIIASLIDYADAVGDQAYFERAERMAHWEAEIQMPSGAVQGGRIDLDQKPTPAAFNTGMVLHGWARFLARKNDPTIFDAAKSAADFLVDDMNEHGQFRTNGAFVSEFAVKNYNSLCAWALYLFGDVSEDAKYHRAAIRAVESAMSVQHDNGWMPNNSLGRHDAVLTHTLGYTLQAFLETGLLAGRQDMIDAARLGVDAVVPHIHKNGFLVSWFYPDWTPALFSSCLTGSAQLAIVMYRLAESTGEASYVEHANRLMGFLKSRQIVSTGIDGVRGALPGSFPILGQYITRGYPNWATKYLLDALLLQHKAN